MSKGPKYGLKSLTGNKGCRHIRAKQKHGIETCVKYLIGPVVKVIFRCPKLIVSPNKENVKGQSEGS